MATVALRRLTIASALLAGLAACAPTPYGSADQGVAAGSDRNALNAPYYQGSDPNHPRSKGGGSN